MSPVPTTAALLVLLLVPAAEINAPSPITMGVVEHNSKLLGPIVEGGDTATMVTGQFPCCVRTQQKKVLRDGYSMTRLQTSDWQAPFMKNLQVQGHTGGKYWAYVLSNYFFSGSRNGINLDHLPHCRYTAITKKQENEPRRKIDELSLGGRVPTCCGLSATPDSYYPHQSHFIMSRPTWMTSFHGQTSLFQNS